MSDQSNTDSGSSSRTWLIIGIAAIALLVLLALVFLLGQNSGSSGSSNPTPVPPDVSVPTPDPSAPFATANVDINVRSGPSTAYPSYGVAPAGATAGIVGVSPDGGWWNIAVDPANIPEGNAWVSGEFVTAQNADGVPVVQPPPLPPEAEIPVPGPDDPKITTVEVVNVRSGPGTEYPAYGLAPPGAQGLVAGKSEDGEWWAVELPTAIAPDGLGWLSADWVVPENTDGVPVIPAP